MSGEYGGCGKTSQSSVNNFYWVCRDVCDIALSWWKTTPLRFTNSGRFSWIAAFNLSSWLQYTSELIVLFCSSEVVCRTQYSSNPTKLRAWSCSDEALPLKWFVTVCYAASTIFCAWYYCRRSIFCRQLPYTLEMDLFPSESLMEMHWIKWALFSLCGTHQDG